MNSVEEITGLSEDCGMIEYIKSQSGILLGAHHGQEKLYAVEKLALRKWRKFVKNVVYAGAAQGYHIPRLAREHRDVMFYLVDPSFTESQSASLRREKNVRVIRDFFTDDLAKEFVNQLGSDFVFWSDIRSDNSAEADFVSNSEDRFVIEDMVMQARWVKIMNVHSMLKFRAPWEGYKDGFPYLDGVLVAQPWARASSCELRLFVKPNCGTRSYGWKSIEMQMAAHNMFSRPWVDFEMHEMYTGEEASASMFTESNTAEERGAALRIGQRHFRPDLMRKYKCECTEAGAEMLRQAYLLYKSFMHTLGGSNEAYQAYQNKEKSGDAWREYTPELLRVYCEMKVLQRYSESDYALVEAMRYMPTPKSVVSLGGGIGSELLPYHDRFGCSVTSVDVSRTALTVAEMVGITPFDCDARIYDCAHSVAICSYVPFLLDDLRWLEAKVVSGQYRYVIIINRSKVITSSVLHVISLAGSQMYLLCKRPFRGEGAIHRFQPPYNTKTFREIKAADLASNDDDDG